MKVYEYKFNEQYLKQQNLPMTQENLDGYGLDKDYMQLLFENDRYWIVRYYESNETINCIYKDDSNMVAVEI